MAQVLRRRYRRSLENPASLPDLVIIDGGKGQLSRAAAVFEELGLDSTPLLGVAKGASRKAGYERLIMNGREVVPGRSEERRVGKGCRSVWWWSGTKQYAWYHP